MSVFRRRHRPPPRPEAGSEPVARLEVIAEQAADIAEQIRRTVEELRAQDAERGMLVTHLPPDDEEPR